MKNRFALALSLLFLALPSIPAAAQTGSWTPTGSMNVGRYTHVAVLLPNGTVLVAGGRDDNDVETSSCEVYDPYTGSWTTVASMSTARAYAQAVVLTSGKVLVSGGFDAASQELATAELFDPVTRQWTPTGSMNDPRFAFASTLLQSGSVLVFGGYQQQTGITLRSAETYDPTTGVWTMVGNMNEVRAQPSSARLNDGRVLAAGGLTCCPYQNFASSEAFSPSTGTWTPTGNLTMTRGAAPATLLSDGSVFVTGGLTGTQPNWPVVASSERFDPLTNAWSARASMGHVRENHTATLLVNGRVLAAGGDDRIGWLSSAEVYDPVTDSWLPAGAMSAGRNLATATRLLDGRVLVAGGQPAAYSGGMRGTEIYTYLYLCFPDADGDGFGDTASPGVQGPCASGYAPNNFDCDDNNAAVHPGAPEICNGVDDDCDGAVDDGLVFDYYADMDGDNYGFNGTGLTTCSPPPGYVLIGGDCNDNDPAIHPGAPELCDGVDNDCNGIIDDGFLNTYCTAGTTVHGCVPSIEGIGTPSTTATCGFEIVASHVEGMQNGLIFYGAYPIAIPWSPASSSYRCVAFPIERTTIHNSGGVAGQCNGTLSVDFNAWASAHPGALATPFVPGQVLYAQGWFRDPAAPRQTNLSNALRFTFCN